MADIMKTSFKTNTLIAAIATTLFIIISRLLIPLDISDFGGNPILWQNKSTPLIWLCILSYILMCVSFYKSQLDLSKPSIAGRVISGLFIVIFAFLVIEHLTHSYLNPLFPSDRIYRIVYYSILPYSIMVVLWCMYIFYDKLGIQVCLIKQTHKFRKNVLALAVIMSVALVLDVVVTSIDVATSDSWIQYGGPKYGDWSFISGILQNFLRCTIYVTLICLCWKILFFKKYVNPGYSVSITTSSVPAGGKDLKLDIAKEQQKPLEQ
jgi:hypothetical protein